MGASLSDLGGMESIYLPVLLSPLLLVPSLAALSSTDHHYVLRANAVHAAIGQDGSDALGLQSLASLAQVNDATILQVDGRGPTEAKVATRVTTAAAKLAAIDAFAARTYAPATEASRAGAGPA